MDVVREASKHRKLAGSARMPMKSLKRENLLRAMLADLSAESVDRPSPWMRLVRLKVSKFDTSSAMHGDP